MNISNNVSSMQAHQQMMNTNANNVANVNTDGFRPSDTRMTNGAGDSVIAQNRLADDTGSLKSQTDLTKEMPDQIVAEKANAVNVSAIRTQDEMMGSLLDLKA